MSSYSEFKMELLEDPEVKAAYDELQPEYDIIQAMVDARKSQNMTRKDLPEATGIHRRIEKELFSSPWRMKRCIRSAALCRAGKRCFMVHQCR